MVGRAAFWTLPTLDKPLDLVLLDLDWENEDHLAAGTKFLEQMTAKMRELGAEETGYVLDSPSCWPQWQHFPEKRIILLKQIGFKIQRETYRFEWNDKAALSAISHDLIFRTFTEAGEARFVEAIKRVTEGTLDRRSQRDRELLGEEMEAQSMFEDLTKMEYDPAWWQLAYAHDGQLIGLVMPAKSPTFATIGYIGVVPEYRGKGFIRLLLHHGTETLINAGETAIRADTDVNNIPMANAFRKIGYVQFCNRREYSLKLNR